MGIFIATSIMLTWLGHLIYTLTVVEPNPFQIEFWVHLLIQTWLFTGLFISAHDAMHGTVSKNTKTNKTIGITSTVLYAGMWYPTLLKKHKEHHLSTGTENDPDYYTGNQNFFIWWFNFMKTYLTIWQILIMAIFFNIGIIYFSEMQLIYFWIIPAILSTFQLFYFGTYIPHKLPHSEEMGIHKSRTQKVNHIWALLSCFFFGYHKEHHESPQTPWWKLYRLK